MVGNHVHRSPERPPMFTLPTRLSHSAARRVSWPLYSYAGFQDFILLYPFYAVLFADTGLSVTQITSLFILWSLSAILLEIPSGALADIVPRRLLLACAPLCAAAGFTLWLLFPSYWAFALGFVLWGAGGTLASGALEALVYTELDTRGASEQYATIMGRAEAIAVTAVGASTLVAVPVMSIGGYTAVGVASVAACVLCAAAAWFFPEHRVAHETPEDNTREYLATLRAGLGEATSNRTVLGAVLLAAVIPAIWEALEEYVPLLAVDSGVHVEQVPWVVFIVWGCVAAGSLCAGIGYRLSPSWLAALVGAAAGALASGALLSNWLLVGAAFGVFQMAAVVAGARLQHNISGPSRATVTSVSGLFAEVITVGVFVVYAAAHGIVGHAWSFALFAVLYVFVAVAVGRIRTRGVAFRSRTGGAE